MINDTGFLMLVNLASENKITVFLYGIVPKNKPQSGFFMSEVANGSATRRIDQPTIMQHENI